MPSKNHPPALGTLKAGKAFTNTTDGRALVAELQAVADSPEWQAWVAKLKTELGQGKRDWEARHGETCPASISDWQRLLVRAGVNPNEVLAGHIEMGDAASIVRGYLERVRDNAAASPAPADVRTGAAVGTYTYADLQGMTGLGNDTIRKHAKAAKVAVPARGQRNFRYSLVDTRRILQAIVDTSSTKTHRDKARAALAKLSEDTK